ncbi:MAG: hypothetical protein P1V51_05680 [Deltaproteobacteria bacterium]|nr:hypothetical protein [Deltaproteobacteria bacterium]
MRLAGKWSSLLVLVLCLAACPPQAEEGLGEAEPIAAPVEATPVLFSAVEAQVPVGMSSYQVLLIEWEGMKPHTGIFERFVRGHCYVRASYTFAEGGSLVQTPPLYRSAEAGATLDPKLVVYGEALEAAVGKGREKSRVQRDSLGALSWVWQEQESGREKIWTFTYPEGEVCVPPGVLAREILPAKLKPALLKEGPLPGETPSDPSQHPLAPVVVDPPAATDAK